MRKQYETLWAGARKLKDHCHDITQTLGSGTPPEVFLFRGNAYYALGYPYLALADYENASRFLSISANRHQEKCWEAARRFPCKQQAVFPGSNSHLHICVNPFLESRCKVEQLGDPALLPVPSNCSSSSYSFFRSEKDGLFALQDLSLTSRRVVAVENIPSPLTPVLKAPSFAASHSHHSGPWLQYPLFDRCCARCCRPLDHVPTEKGSSSSRSFPCRNSSCHEEYCSRDCRELALQEYHSAVCDNAAAQAIEMSLYNEMQATPDALRHRQLSVALLTLRVMSASLATRASPTAIPQMRILSGKLRWSPIELCGWWREHYQQVADALRIVTTVSYEEYLGVYARVWCNAHWEESSDEGGKSSGASPDTDPECVDYRSIVLRLPYAMFNHSCRPNVVEQVTPTGHRLPILVTSHPVLKGEELTRSYFPQSWLELPFAARQKAMKAFDFDCSCARCKEESMHESN